MADDGRSDYQTVGTAGTPRSPTRAGTRRDAIRRRALRHAIRRRALRHATTIPDAVSGDRRYRTRRAQRDAIRRRGHLAATGLMGRRDRRRIIRHTMIISCPIMPGYARICPDMPGYARICPDDVQLFPVMSRCHVCPATALRAASGPTLGLKRAAGGFHRWHHETA